MWRVHPLQRRIARIALGQVGIALHHNRRGMPIAVAVARLHHSGLRVHGRQELYGARCFAAMVWHQQQVCTQRRIRWLGGSPCQQLRFLRLLNISHQ